MAKRKLKPLSDEDVEKIAKDAVQKAVNFIDMDISEDRVKSERYFQGETDLEAETGRSQVVITKARDIVRAVKPSLIRVFLYSDKPVQYAPVGPSDQANAEQATQYMHWRFGELGGEMILNSVFQDAMVKKAGYTKAYWDTSEEVEWHTWEGIDDTAAGMLLDDPDVEVLEHTEEPDPDAEPQPQIGQDGQPVVGPDGQPVMAPQPMLHDLRVYRKIKRSQLAIVAVPPEELVVNKEAVNIENLYVIAQRTNTRLGDILAMGFELEDLEDCGPFSSTSDDDEKEARTTYRPTPRDDEDDTIDPTTELIGLTEAYMKLDIDGIGIPCWHKILLVGEQMKLLDHEPVEDHPFAKWEIDPEPHTFFGRSLVEIVEQDQDAMTSLMRGILDNVQMVNNPRVAALEGYVNLDDLMNGEIGAIVREQQPNAVRDLTVPFVAGNTLPVFQMMDANVEVKSGVTKASQGLDPDAMQSTNKMAVQANIQASAAQVEYMARMLAISGMTRLFKQCLKLYVKHVKKETIMQLTDGNWVPVDPRSWKASMDCRPVVGLGTGREEERAMALETLAAEQGQVLTTQGLQNGLYSMQTYRNAKADALRLRGVVMTDRYILPMDPVKEQGIAQAQAQAAQQPPPPDPTQALIEAEKIKAQAKGAADAANAALKQEQMRLDDDLKRDQMDQDLGIAMAKLLGEYGIKLDTARIKAEQAAARPANGPADGAPSGAPPAGGPSGPPAGMVQ
jgi:hypothetical protein